MYPNLRLIEVRLGDERLSANGIPSPQWYLPSTMATVATVRTDLVNVIVTRTRDVIVIKNQKRKEALKETAEIFDCFWSVYPRRQGKAQARVAFDKASKVCDPKVIIAAAERFALDPNREDQYTPHPTTWLNQGRWDDDPLPAKGSKFHDTMTEIYAATQREGNLFQ